MQIVNYDNIMSHKPASLPLITTQNHTFRRLYEYTGAGHVRFVTHLANNFNDGVVIQSTLLLLCERAFLEEELKRRFQKVEFFWFFRRFALEHRNISYHSGGTEMKHPE